MKGMDASGLHGGISQADAKRGMTAWNLFATLGAVVCFSAMIYMDMKLSADSLTPYLGPEMGWIMSIGFGNFGQYVLMVYATDKKWTDSQSQGVVAFIMILLALSYVFDIATNYDGFVTIAETYRKSHEMLGPVPIATHLIAMVAGILLAFTEWFLQLAVTKFTSDISQYRNARKPQQQGKPGGQQQPQQNKGGQQQQKGQPPQQNKGQPHRPPQASQPGQLTQALKDKVIAIAQQTGQSIEDVAETGARQIAPTDKALAENLRAWAKTQAQSKQGKPPPDDDDDEDDD